MSRGRAFTRHQAARAKASARLVLRQWGSEPAPRQVGRLAGVHCKPCSSPWCCGNPRTMCGETRHEILAALTEREQRREI